MPAMHIDPQNGTVTLPGGCAIAPGLTREAFCAGDLFAQARDEGQGALPWTRYRLAAGRLEGHELLATLCFHDQTLVQVSLSADLYPPGPRDWSTYSLDVEAATKELHDRLLEQLLGPPTRTDRLSPGGLTPAQATLARPHWWTFPWGSVVSGHDSKGGSTLITIRYGPRLEQATRPSPAERPGPP